VAPRPNHFRVLADFLVLRFLRQRKNRIPRLKIEKNGIKPYGYQARSGTTLTPGGVRQKAAQASMSVRRLASMLDRA
jgi:hypothetical protein